nr:unnamed protein product [Spirometra erinaceieuropaei]
MVRGSQRIECSSVIRALYGTPTKATAALLSVDGSTLFTGKTNSEATDRTLPGRPQPSLHNLRRRYRPSASCGGQRRPRPLALSLHETIRNVQQLSSGKAPRLDAIPAEPYKHDGPRPMDDLMALFQEIWRQEDLQDFKDATIVHL